MSTSSPSYYRNYEMLTSSPFHITNSQAPIPGKEVFWDYDTPQSRTQEKGIATLEAKLSKAKLLPIFGTVTAIRKTVCQEEDRKMEESRHKKMQYRVSRSQKK